MTAAVLTQSGDIAAPSLPAAGSSFYLAMRILPRERRKGMYAIYAFCRAVDDVADHDGPRDQRLAALERWRTDIDDLYAGQDTSARLVPLYEAIRRFGLRREDFNAVIDGMVMDVAADMRAPDWATLDLYCDRVASAVGRLSVRIFGLDGERGAALAHHLGRALQLTNILRDLDEDATLDRLYLPREALLAAGLDQTRPDVVLRDRRLAAVCAEIVARAEHHFGEADRLMARCPRAAVRAPRLMAAAYGSILRQLQQRGWNPPRAPVSASKRQLLLALLRYGLV
jgi:presqualene diphosphate synthase